MKATEFRIGNYVYAQSGKMVINRDSIYKIENINLQSAKKYEPIPLTKEWLLKFEFHKVESYLVKGHIKLLQIRDLYWRANYPITIDIKYVHQLQNIYFALTGEELTQVSEGKK